MLGNTRCHIVWKKISVVYDIPDYVVFTFVYSMVLQQLYTLIFYFLSESERLLSTVAAKTLLRMDIPVNNIKSAINNFIKSNGEYYYHILQFMLQLYNTKYWWRFPGNNIFKLVFMWRIGDALLTMEYCVSIVIWFLYVKTLYVNIVNE